MSTLLRRTLPAIVGAVSLSLSALFASTIFARAQDECPSLYQAGPGETLVTIAERCRMPLGDLFRANPALRQSRMPLDGMTVHIPENRDPSPVNWSALTGPPPASEPRDSKWRGDGADFWTPLGDRDVADAGSYRVRDGDTLADISDYLNISLTDLLAANPQIGDPDALYAGERINVPGGTDLVAGEGGERFRHRYHLAPHITAVPTGDGNLRVLAVGLPPNAEVSLSAARVSDHGSFATTRASGRGTVKLDVPLPPEFAHDGNHVVIASVNGEVRASSQPIGTIEPGAASGSRDGFYGAAYRGVSYDDDDYGYVHVGERLTVNGVVTPEGNQCPAVRDASGKLYSLATTNETLHPGDVVSIDGRVAPGDWCSKGIALAVSSLHFQPAWTAARNETAPAVVVPPATETPSRDFPRYRPESDLPPVIVTPDRDRRSNFTTPQPLPPSGAPEIIRGVLTDEAGDCTTVRGDDGTLYAIPARLTSAALGQRLEIKGHLANRSICSVGVTFRVDDARKL